MKSFDSLTRDELIGLTDDQIGRYIDLAVAEEGIKPVDQPAEVKLADAGLKQTDKCYSVYGVLFRNQKDAEAVARMEVLKENYDWNHGYNYQWVELKTDNDVSTKMYYQKDDVRRLSSILVELKEKKESYEKKKSAWDKYCTSISGIKSRIWSSIHEARDRAAEVRQATVQFNKYVDLADGNADIAERFFRKAYKDDDQLISEIFSLMRIENHDIIFAPGRELLEVEVEESF